MALHLTPLPITRPSDPPTHHTPTTINKKMGASKKKKNGTGDKRRAPNAPE